MKNLHLTLYLLVKDPMLSLDSNNKVGISILTASINIILEVLATVIREEKAKGMKMKRKKENHLHLQILSFVQKILENLQKQLEDNNKKQDYKYNK